MERPAGALVLGHGAAGGVSTPDLIAATGAARTVGISVALIEQPYRVAGRRNQPPARQLDEDWIAVVAHLRAGALRGLDLVVGGRSAGARVACRTAEQVRAVAVVCLAFPLHPPGRGDDPAKSRLPELNAVSVPTLIIQGERDPFGVPPPAPNREVVLVPGNHALRSPAAIGAALVGWLPSVLFAADGPRGPQVAGDFTDST